MGCYDIDLLGTSFLEKPSGEGDGMSSIDHVIYQDSRLPSNVSDQKLHSFFHVWLEWLGRLFAYVLAVDEGKVESELVGDSGDPIRVQDNDAFRVVC